MSEGVEEVGKDFEPGFSRQSFSDRVLGWTRMEFLGWEFSDLRFQI